MRRRPLLRGDLRRVGRTAAFPYYRLGPRPAVSRCRPYRMGLGLSPQAVEAVGSCKPPVRVGGGLFKPWRDASTARYSEGPRRRIESGTVGVIEGKRVPSGMEAPVRGDASETHYEGKQRIGVQQTKMRTHLIRQQSSRRMCIPACPPCYPTLKIAPQALPNTIPAGGEFRGPEGPFPNFERTLHRDRRSRPQRLSAPHPTLHQRIGNTDKRTHAPARTSPPNGTQSPQRKCRTQDNHVAEGYLPTQPTQYASSRSWVGLPLPRVGSEPITPTVPDSLAAPRTAFFQASSISYVPFNRRLGPVPGTRGHGKFGHSRGHGPGTREIRPVLGARTGDRGHEAVSCRALCARRIGRRIAPSQGRHRPP